MQLNNTKTLRCDNCTFRTNRSNLDDRTCPKCNGKMKIVDMDARRSRSWHRDAKQQELEHGNGNR
jgi:hypothetical protein